MLQKDIKCLEGKGPVVAGLGATNDSFHLKYVVKSRQKASVSICKPPEVCHGWIRRDTCFSTMG